jgi:hypothetical protein
MHIQCHRFTEVVFFLFVRNNVPPEAGHAPNSSAQTLELHNGYGNEQVHFKPIILDIPGESVRTVSFKHPFSIMRAGSSVRHLFTFSVIPSTLNHEHASFSTPRQYLASDEIGLDAIVWLYHRTARV